MAISCRSLHAKTLGASNRRQAITHFLELYSKKCPLLLIDFTTLTIQGTFLRLFILYETFSYVC